MAKRGVMRDKLYLPIKYVDATLYSTIQKTFSKEIKIFVSPALCSSCYREHEGEPPCEGDKCPYTKKRLLMYDKLKTKKGNFIALWRGDIPLLKKALRGFKVKDKRCYSRVRKELRFTGTLRTYQIKAALDWVRGKSGGQIMAPARSGKTVLGCYLTCRLGYKTLILAHQIDLLEQFYDTFIKFSSFKENGKIPQVAISKKGNIAELFDSGVDVILSTYQTFLSKTGKSRLKAIRNKFGFVVVDESHLVGADGFSKIISSLNPFLFLGLTATPDRKDGRDILAKYSLGNVVSSVEPPQLTGTATMIHTGTGVGDWRNWTTMVSRLASNNRRNKLIIGYVKKDLKVGHILVLVTERRKQCETLQEMLKEEGIKAEILYGNIDNRKALIDKMREGKIAVTIATRKIVRFGLNVPPWSAYYCLSPTNNPPNFYQEMSRVRTPHKGKKTPLVRYFVDGFKAAYSCARTCEKVLIEQKFKIVKESIDDNVLKDARRRREANKVTKDTIKGWNKFAGIK